MGSFVRDSRCGELRHVARRYGEPRKVALRPRGEWGCCAFDKARMVGVRERAHARWKSDDCITHRIGERDGLAFCFVKCAHRRLGIESAERGEHQTEDERERDSAITQVAHRQQMISTSVSRHVAYLSHRSALRLCILRRECGGKRVYNRRMMRYRRLDFSNVRIQRARFFTGVYFRFDVA